MEKPKKQHFVPQFYLKHFGSPLYCYDKLKDKSFPTSHRDAGQENYFYEIDGIPTGSLEKFLATGEGRFSQAYNRLASTKDLKKLTQTERANFFLFLAVQVFRTHEERFSFKEQSDKVLDAIFGKNGMNIIPENLKVTYSEDSIKKIQLQMLIEDTPRIAAILSKKTWIVRENHTDVPLLTSDNPVALHNQLEFQDGWGNLGLVSPGIEIHIPLKSDLLLFSYDPTTHKLKDGI